MSRFDGGNGSFRSFGMLEGVLVLEGCLFDRVRCLILEIVGS
jgi:hypothetical protein